MISRGLTVVTHNTKECIGFQASHGASSVNDKNRFPQVTCEATLVYTA